MLFSLGTITIPRLNVIENTPDYIIIFFNLFQYSVYFANAHMFLKV